VMVRGGTVVETAATGARATGQAPQVTTADRWHIGSLTKAMTATVAAVLVQRGQITWSTRVRDVFPDLVATTRAQYLEATLTELLSHTAGMPVDVTRAPSWPTLRSGTGPLKARRRAFAAELLAMPPDGPRGGYAYSNAGYIVAGTMLEEVTGVLWEDLMRQELLTPLGMTASGFGAPGAAGTPDQPWGHVRQGASWVAVAPGPQADNPEVLGPAGTAHATLADYARYMAEHLAGARGGGSLLPPAAFTTLHAPVPGTTYGLGWGVGTRTWANGRVLSHAGSNTLWYAVVWIAPERNLAMFAVTNAGGDTAAGGTDDAIVALISRFNAAFP
jgi:CubicO group peptidase (beta-lactamase class C family)